MRKLILVLILYFLSGCASAGMADEKGKVIDKQYDTVDLNKGLIKVHHNYGISDVVRHCDLKGYFIYNNTIFMCVKIREGITQAELRDYAKEEKIRLEKRYAEYLRSLADDQKHK